MSDARKYRVLRTDLPVEVWDRLDAEAREHDMKIGAYIKHLIVARDAKRVSRNPHPLSPISEPSDISSNRK